jgi:hypothetical protein
MLRFAQVVVAAGPRLLVNGGIRNTRPLGEKYGKGSAVSARYEHGAGDLGAELRGPGHEDPRSVIGACGQEKQSGKNRCSFVALQRPQDRPRALGGDGCVFGSARPPQGPCRGGQAVLTAGAFPRGGGGPPGLIRWAGGGRSCAASSFSMSTTKPLVRGVRQGSPFLWVPQNSPDRRPGGRSGRHRRRIRGPRRSHGSPAGEGRRPVRPEGRDRGRRGGMRLRCSWVRFLGQDGGNGARSQPGGQRLGAWAAQVDGRALGAQRAGLDVQEGTALTDLGAAAVTGDQGDGHRC